MTDYLSIDFETYSATDIRVGTYKYAMDAEVMLFSYQLNGEPVKTWDRTEGGPMPADLREPYLDPSVKLIAHNTLFERQVSKYALDIDLPASRFEDTMILALTCGLPAKMEHLCAALGMDESSGKLTSGSRLINLFCKPAPKNHLARRYTRENRPKEWEEFIAYCERDVEVCWDLWSETLPHWTYDQERETWLLDQRINDAGIPIHVEFAQKAVDMVEAEMERLAHRIRKITGGVVQSVSDITKMKAWMNDRGVVTGSLAADVVSQRLEGDSIPDDVREVLEIRQAAGKSSVAKYVAAMAAHHEGRIYGGLQHYGALRTGRWAGRVIQPQNFPRPELKGTDMDSAISATMNGTVPLLFDSPVAVAASCARAMIGAKPGNKLVVSDLANIEGRVLAWLAGEEWKLEAFRAYDAGTGPDLYKVAYARSFEMDDPNEVTPDQRQVGKVLELSMGYQGAVGAFKDMAVTYQLRNLPPDKVLKKWVKGWRAAHPRTKSLWYACDNAALAAIKDPGSVIVSRGIKWLVEVHADREFLLCKLPSGRLLAYASPEYETVIVRGENDDGFTYKFEKEQISYEGYIPMTYKWDRVRTFGGKLVENIDQATSRDVMVPGMINAERDGFGIVLTVHDEIVTEQPDDDEWSVERLNACLVDGPAWCAGLPLAAAGYESYYYKKD